jgi:hypothetical protein
MIPDPGNRNKLADCLGFTQSCCIIINLFLTPFKEKFEAICESVFSIAKNPQLCKNPHIQNALISLLPRLAASNKERFVCRHLAETMAYIYRCLQAGLEKNRIFLENPAQCFFFIFLGFLGILGFFGFFRVFLPRVFRVFFSFTNTFRCIQTLNYNHSY